MYNVEATGGLLLSGHTQATTAAQREGADERGQESALVEQVRAGDREAFGRLYARYGRLVHGILLARVPYGEVDDLVQDVFMTALRKIDTLRDAGAFGPWVAMIARNRAMDFHRRSRETEELHDGMAHAPRPTAEADEALE